jgi:hypothetical protein
MPSDADTIIENLLKKFKTSGRFPEVRGRIVSLAEISAETYLTSDHLDLDHLCMPLVRALKRISNWATMAREVGWMVWPGFCVLALGLRSFWFVAGYRSSFPNGLLQSIQSSALSMFGFSSLK